MLEHVHQAAQEAIRAAARRRRNPGDPDRNPSLLNVYVIWAWHATRRQWWLAGFTSGSNRRLTVRTMDRYCRKAKIPRGTPVKFVELLLAHRDGPPKDDPTKTYSDIRRRVLSRALPITSSTLRI